MKKLSVLLCIFLLSACAPSEVPLDKLLERNGLKYEINSQTPFTGVATEYYESGQLEFKDTYKGGKRNGIYEEYHRNGQLAYKDTYKGGRRNGPSERYYENGQLRWKLAYKDEKQHGPNERYYENGQLMATFTNKDGRLHGLFEGYSENGKEQDGSPVCYQNDKEADISKCK